MQKSEFIKIAAMPVNTRNVAKLLSEAPRSWAERGLMKAVDKLDAKFPIPAESLIDRLTRQIKNVRNRPPGSVDSWDAGTELNSLNNQLRDAMRADAPPDMSWRQMSTRNANMKPAVNALMAEQHRLGKLSPERLAREKFRMNSILESKAPPAQTERQIRIQQLAEANRNKGEEAYYW